MQRLTTQRFSLPQWAAGLLACALATSVQAGDIIRVKAGETLALEGNKTEWVLDELVLEDGATLTIPAALAQIQIDAQKAQFGKNSRIVAQGAAIPPTAQLA